MNCSHMPIIVAIGTIAVIPFAVITIVKDTLETGRRVKSVKKILNVNWKCMFSTAPTLITLKFSKIRRTLSRRDAVNAEKLL